MSAKKDPNDQWRQTTVVIRSDIFLKAVELGLDISNECNLALANQTGIDYRQQHLSDRVIADPAILDADTQTKELKKTSRKTPLPDIHPVINADDPTAITKVMKATQRLQIKPVAEDPILKDSSPVSSGIAQKTPVKGGVIAGRGKVIAPEKKKKDDILKKFVVAKIIRVDADDAVVTKDDMYQAFTRWCRDHRIVTIPERKVIATSLKNKFALTEKTINGNPCWMNVRMK
jgi:hypothetical protein